MPVTTVTDLRAPVSAQTPAVSQEVSCQHCGLPVPASLRQAGVPEQFCCSGCRAAYGLLTEAGLDGYYTLRERVGESGRALGDAEAHFSEFDSQAFQALYCERTPNGTSRVELRLEGVHCAACVWLVERLPRLEPAVVSARLNMAQSVVALEWFPGQNDASEEGERAEQGFRPPRAGSNGATTGAALSQIAQTLSSMGYRPRPLRGQRASDVHRAELRGLMIRMGVAGASAANAMLIAFALYSGAESDLGLSSPGFSVRTFFHWASLVVSLPALFAGSLFFRGAISSLRTRTPHMDLPIALGILAGFSWGTYGVIVGEGEIYFDSITALIFLLLVGRYLQARHQIRGAEAAELLLSVVPHTVELLGRGKPAGTDEAGLALVVSGQNQSPCPENAPIEAVSRVAMDEVRAGDVVLVRSGQVVPVDGCILSGHSALDRSLLSGEALPVSAIPGERIEAGCVNLGAPLRILVDKAGAETRVGRLLREVERAQQTRSPTVQMADRIAGIFTVAVLGLAVLVFALSFAQGPAEALSRALALLVVSCPCALGMATPLALNAAISQAARNKTLIFGGAALEALAEPCLILLDKTGTLTEGKLSLADRVGATSWDGVALAMESGAHHPAAVALSSHLAGRGVTPALLDSEVREALGAGLTVEHGGDTFRIGSEAFVLAHCSLASELRAKLDASPASLSPVFFARGPAVVSIFFFEDQVRPDAQASLVALRAEGHQLAILSGDRPLSVQAVASTLSAGQVDFFAFVRGGASPEDKLAVIRAETARGKKTVMVGDGLNDAAALSAASVGVAVSCAAEASQLSADVFLATAGVGRLLHLFQGARRLRNTVRRGIIFSLCYNAVGISLAAFGLLSPLGAAVLMPLSSLTVISHALRSRMFRAETSLS